MAKETHKDRRDRYLEYALECEADAKRVANRFAREQYKMLAQSWHDVVADMDRLGVVAP